MEDNCEDDLTVYLEPKQREELTAECLEDNRLAYVKLIKVQLSTLLYNKQTNKKLVLVSVYV